MAEELDYAGAGGLRVLDVGCGQGIDLANFAKAGASVVGLDLTPRHAELARAHLSALGLNVEALVGDAESMPFPDSSFDRVTSNGVLHHTPNIAKALGEIHRVLREAGEVRIILYNKGSLHYWLTQVAYVGLLRGGLFRHGSMSDVLSSSVEFSRIGARPLVNVYTSRQVQGLLRDAGFVDVSVHPRHFNMGDTPITAPFQGRVPFFERAHILDRVGRLAGWYLVGIARRGP